MRQKIGPSDIDEIIKTREAEIEDYVNLHIDVSYAVAKKMVDEQERKSMDKFVAKHKPCKGECLTSFYPSGIGTKICIRCNHCDQEEDISDYDHW